MIAAKIRELAFEPGRPPAYDTAAFQERKREAINRVDRRGHPDDRGSGRGGGVVGVADELRIYGDIRVLAAGKP